HPGTPGKLPDAAVKAFQPGTTGRPQFRGGCYLFQPPRPEHGAVSVFLDLAPASGRLPPLRRTGDLWCYEEDPETPSNAKRICAVNDLSYFRRADELPFLETLPFHISPLSGDGARIH